MISELDTPILCCCVIHLRTKEVFDIVINEFSQVYCDLKRSAADACLFFQIGETSYVTIEVETIGQWMAKISEVATLPYLDKLGYDSKELECHYSSVIGCMKEKIDMWEQYPNLHVSYSNSRGIVNGENLVPRNPFVLVCNLSFVDGDAKNCWADAFEARVLASEDYRNPVCIMLDTGALSGLAIVMDTADRWRNAGAHVPGVTAGCLDAGVESLVVQHVHINETNEALSDDIRTALDQIQGCSFQSMRSSRGSFVGGCV